MRTPVQIGDVVLFVIPMTHSLRPAIVVGVIDAGTLDLHVFTKADDVAFLPNADVGGVRAGTDQIGGTWIRRGA